MIIRKEKKTMKNRKARKKKTRQKINHGNTPHRKRGTSRQEKEKEKGKEKEKQAHTSLART